MLTLVPIFHKHHINPLSKFPCSYNVLRYSNFKVICDLDLWPKVIHLGGWLILHRVILRYYGNMSLKDDLNPCISSILKKMRNSKCQFFKTCLTLIWPWPVGLRSKVISYSESPYMNYIGCFNYCEAVKSILHSQNCRFVDFSVMLRYWIFVIFSKIDI